MNICEHILIITAEEIGEILKEFLSPKHIELEMCDLLAMFDLMVEHNIIKKLDHKVCYTSEKEFLLNLHEFQHILFKTLRFGLEDINPTFQRDNFSLLSEFASKVECYINYYLTNFGQLNVKEAKKNKKEKVILFLELSSKKGCLHG